MHQQVCVPMQIKCKSFFCAEQHCGVVEKLFEVYNYRITEQLIVQNNSDGRLNWLVAHYYCNVNSLVLWQASENHFCCLAVLAHPVFIH